MTSSTKAYSAPRLEALSLRQTKDIEIHIGVLDIQVDFSVQELALLS